MKSNAVSSDLADLPALKVLLRARAEGRMPHAVLLTGADDVLLEKAAEKLAAIHLDDGNPVESPDCRVLRPAKKSRRINIDTTQQVVAGLRLTSVGARRVVIVHEPDRFESSAANAFLKSLEEPPPGTLIVLQTTNYYRVMATILSRCLRFHIGGLASAVTDPAWLDWLREFDRLMTRMVNGPSSPTSRVSEVFIPLYALCARFEVLQELFVDEALKDAPPPPPTDDDEDEIEEAHEASVRRGVRHRMLVSIEERLRLMGRVHPECGAHVALAVEYLEEARARLELSYQSVAAMEQFFLQTLRSFAVRVRPEPSGLR